MSNTVSKTQIIYDDDGTPAFVVIPFAQFRQFVPQADAALSDEELFDMAMADRHGPAVPHAVMARLIDGENPVKVYREWRALTQSESARWNAASDSFPARRRQPSLPPLALIRMIWIAADHVRQPF
jgi:hypothetical protein